MQIATKPASRSGPGGKTPEEGALPRPGASARGGARPTEGAIVSQRRLVATQNAPVDCIAPVPRTRARRQAWAAALALCGWAAAAQAEEAPARCAGLARFGAFDTRSTTSDADRGAALRQWLCQSSIAQEADLASAAGALGLAAGDAPARLGYDARAESLADWRDRFCAMPDAPATRARLAAAAKGMLPGVAAALAQCDSPGLSARLETTARPCEALLRLSPAAPAPAAPLDDVKLVSTDPTLACGTLAFETPFTLAGPMDVPCRRHNDGAAVLMLASPRAGVGRLDRMMELAELVPPPEATLPGEFQVDVAWRDRQGRTLPMTSDVWRLSIDKGVCRITGGGGAYTPRSTWFTQATATCSPEELRVTGYRAYDPEARGGANFTLTLRSEDGGDTFRGGGQDNQGRVAVLATATRRGPAAAADQKVCKR